jgi:hypothetical protein
MSPIEDKFAKIDKREDDAIKKLRQGKKLIEEAIKELETCQKEEALLDKQIKK